MMKLEQKEAAASAQGGTVVRRQNRVGAPLPPHVGLLRAVHARTRVDSDDAANSLRKMAALGFTAREVARIEELCSLREGLLLLCGPSTLDTTILGDILLSACRYSAGTCRKVLHTEEILTQIRADTLANGDPHAQPNLAPLEDWVEGEKDNVVMVGEILDTSTAQFAMRMAFGEHLVVAAVSTPSISQAVIRLFDMGVAPCIATAVMRGIIVLRPEPGRIGPRVQVLPPCESSSGAAKK